MSNYTLDDITSVVLVDKKTNTLTIKIFGLKDEETAEAFAHYAMSILNFDYNLTGDIMPSKLIH